MVHPDITESVIDKNGLMKCLLKDGHMAVKADIGSKQHRS